MWDGKEELSTDEVLARRADEFERLSKLCLSDKRPKLALDYCGKASQLRQKVFGEDHPKTVQSLDMFAGIYAEVGRKQYADALLTVEPAEESPLSTMAAGGSSGGQPSKCHYETTSSGDGNLPAGAEIPSGSASTPDRVQAIRLRAGGRARTAIDGTESRLNAGYAEQTPVESSDTDETSVRRHSPSGESDHGRGSSGYKILTTSDGRRRRHVAEEQRTGADVQSSYEVAEDSAHAVSACTLLVFFLISSIVAVLVSILWCHWAQTASCRATGNLLLNLGDHYEHIRTKVIMAAW
ncbi:uncharacterized protein LOC135810522 [Sycon ciliatum]|uniref:uncharacterized protein LOC135810522 n=1 Tax=Sycon ciliatum TaxID=27933 RepID=UPI0031F6BD86